MFNRFQHLLASGLQVSRQGEDGSPFYLSFRDCQSPRCASKTNQLIFPSLNQDYLLEQSALYSSNPKHVQIDCHILPSVFK